MERHNDALDGIRALAALAVLGFHVWLYRADRPHGERTELLDRVLAQASIGLVAFFVLSGFLLYRGFARAALTGAQRPRALSYAVRRAARIVPAYYACCAGCVLLYVTAGPTNILPSAGELPLFAVFGQNYSAATLMQLNPVLWTLSIELAFYAVLPLLALVGLRLGPRRVALHALFLGTLVAATVGWYWLDYANGWGEIPGKTLPAYIGHFAIGMLAALWIERRRGRPLGGGATAVLMGAGIAVVLAEGVWHELAPAGTPARALFATLTAAAGFALIVAAAAAGRGPATAWLRSPMLARVGLVSYGVYLWHLPLLLVLRENGLLPAALGPRLLVVLGAALLAAAASWRLVERPCIAWAARRGRPSAPGSTAYRARSPAHSRPLGPMRNHEVMNVLADSLAHAYQPRLASFVSDERFGDWRLKLYGLAAPEKGVRPELLAATRELAERSLPPLQDAYGVGFAIAHDAAFPIALIYWWQGTNELHQRVYAGTDLDALEPVTFTPSGCVYELAVIEFERRAWIDDVIGNPGGADLERYLGRRFEGLV